MTPLSSSPPLPRLIDIAPLHAAFERLCLLTFVILSDSREVLRNAHKIARATKAVIKAEQEKVQEGLPEIWRVRREKISRKFL